MSGSSARTFLIINFPAAPFFRSLRYSREWLRRLKLLYFGEGIRNKWMNLRKFTDELAFYLIFNDNDWKPGRDPADIIFTS
jgi:hypothetical protein